MAMTFKRLRLLRLNRTALTDHNRSELGVSYERIETRNRMANGTMRKYHVADKRTFTVSWSDVPNVATKTVDGFWSGREIQTFFNDAAGKGVVEIGVTDNLGVEYFVNCVITDFSHSIKKRWQNWELWDFSLTLEEI